MQTYLFASGLVLFLLGLVTGLLVPVSKNPRMGVAGHLQGMTNGPLLIIAGLLWPYLELPDAWQLATFWLLIYGTYANWLGVQLAALWGAGAKLAPIAAGEHRSTPLKERVVTFLLFSLIPAMFAAPIILLIGILR
uniref:Hydroxylaminobenzene mutase HabA n=1 Tax=Ectopseudomonas oleovorans TaxID=301 RepID=HABA_ECTOL|nr:RecName: Full=Hydroxylaminobenzene mutase HabA; Short=HAB mutase; AltName: Full=(Hydroxyamino)benzene mutase [Pseudomonas oleovorans]AAB94122.1 hydroxylaminobenzene mutase [Pseudomonas oleovorans]